jgi:hypothetical protein
MASATPHSKGCSYFVDADNKGCRWVEPTEIWFVKTFGRTKIPTQISHVIHYLIQKEVIP